MILSVNEADNTKYMGRKRFSKKKKYIYTLYEEIGDGLSRDCWIEMGLNNVLKLSVGTPIGPLGDKIYTVNKRRYANDYSII